MPWCPFTACDAPFSSMFRPMVLTGVAGVVCEQEPVSPCQVDVGHILQELPGQLYISILKLGQPIPNPSRRVF